MNVYAEPLRPNRFALQLVRPWVSRLIATLGVVLMTVGLYVPIADRVVLVHSNPVSRYSQTWALTNTVAAPLGPLHLGHLLLLIELGFLAAFSVLTLGGLALIPLLWRSLSPQRAAVLRWTYAVWLVLLTILAVASLPAWRQFMLQPPPGPPLALSTLQASYLLPGALIFPLGMLLSGAALALLLTEPLPAPASAATRRTGWWWIATFALTLGALVWGVGFYLMPETTTAACPPLMFSVTQLAHGACAGLDSDQVLHAAYSAGLGPIALFFFTAGSNFEFVVAAACITTFGGWTRQLSVPALAWLVAWPVLAVGVAIVALQGVGVVDQHGFNLTVATGADWHVAPGMVATFVGIGLVVLGQIGLWGELVRHKGVGNTQKSTSQHDLDDTVRRPNSQTSNHL
ncbi:MAG: hypothetical protein ACLQUY_13610 [Ktedonobacterales bacterium]